MKDRNADYARLQIQIMIDGKTNAKARKRMAEIVIMRADVGRYDDDAIQVWKEYLKTF